MFDETEAMDEILIEHGVHLGYAEKRQTMIAELRRAELAAGDLRMLCEFIRDNGGAKSAPARIAAVLSDKDRWGPLLADLRVHHKIRQGQEEKRAVRQREPGSEERRTNQEQRNAASARWYGMSPREFEWFKYRWTCIDWLRQGHTVEEVCEPQPKGMGCSSAELEAWRGDFTDGRTFDNTIAIYTGMATAEEIEKREAAEDEELERRTAETIAHQKQETQERREKGGRARTPWTPNEYTETAEAKMKAKRDLSD